MRILAVGTLAFCVAATIAAQMPNPADLLKDARARQRKMDDIRDNYTFHQIVKTDDLDDHGAVKKTTTQEHEIFFVNGYRLARLVKKDGAALSAGEDKKEQERIAKLVGQRMKQAHSQRRGGALISQILPVAKISNPRRLSLNGRAALAYDFVGDPRAHGSDMEQNALKKTAGTIWFDEADRQVARVEVHFYDNFRIGGGLLANVQKGTWIELEQSPVGDGLWMQTAVEQHIGARIAFKNFRQNERVTNLDFKKFDVAMEQRIYQP